MADLIQEELEKFQEPEEVSFVIAYTFCIVSSKKFGESELFSFDDIISWRMFSNFLEL